MQALRRALPAVTVVLCVLGGCATPTARGNDPYLVQAYTMWGDSLTAGCEDGTAPQCSYPYQFGQTLIDGIVNNEGIGGQTSTQIAVRMGAVATNVTDAFTIPETGSVSGVTFKPGYEPCRGVGSANAVEGSIDGVKVYCEDAGKGEYTLTRVSTGSIQTVNNGDAWTPILPASALSGMNLIWAGRNGAAGPVCPASGVTPDNCGIAGDIAAMTSYVTNHHGKFLVLTIINGELDGYPGHSTAYATMMAINAWITSTYPNNSYDIRSALVAAYNPANPVDVLDHEHDIPPFSLRAFDNAGKLAVDVTSATTCAVTFGRTLAPTVIVSIASEYILIAGGSDGNYSCTRGYAGSTAATYASGMPWLGADSLHLSGDGTKNTNNQNGTGYTFVAKSVRQWLDSHS